MWSAPIGIFPKREILFPRRGKALSEIPEFTVSLRLPRPGLEFYADKISLRQNEAPYHRGYRLSYTDRTELVFANTRRESATTWI